jgi:hypothetical protein
MTSSSRDRTVCGREMTSSDVIPTCSWVVCVSGAIAHASASASRRRETSRPMLPRIRAMTSPTRSEKEVNERAPIAIHTQNDI